MAFGSSASFRRRVQVTTARLRDESGEIDAVWFGRRFIERRLRAGQEVVVSGRLKRGRRGMAIDNPEFQAIEGDGEVLHAGRIVPVYRLTAGLTAARLRTAMREALDRAGRAYPEYLPPDLRREERLDRRRRGARVGALPGDVRGPRRGSAQAGLRRAARAPARDGRPPARARTRPGAAHRDRRRRRRVDPLGASSTPSGGGSGIRSSSRPTRWCRWTRSDRTSPHRRRCCACSRAMSGRARPRSRRMRSPVRRARASRARCWPRPTCSRASTATRSVRCSRAPASTSSSSPGRSAPGTALTPTTSSPRGRHRWSWGPTRCSPSRCRSRDSGWPSSTSSIGSASSSVASSRPRPVATSPRTSC